MVPILMPVLLLFGLSIAAPPQSNVIEYPKDNVQILRYENNDLGKGSYNFAFELSDGTKHEQHGEVKNEGLDDEYIVMRGSYSWVGPDSVTYTISYVADENGFEPTIRIGASQSAGRSVSHHVATLLGG